MFDCVCLHEVAHRGVCRGCRVQSDSGALGRWRSSQRRDEFGSVRSAQRKIDKEQVGALAGSYAQRLACAVSLQHGVPRVLEHRRYQQPVILLVVHDQDPRHIAYETYCRICASNRSGSIGLAM